MRDSHSHNSFSHNDRDHRTSRIPKYESDYNSDFIVAVVKLFTQHVIVVRTYDSENPFYIYIARPNFSELINKCVDIHSCIVWINEYITKGYSI